MSAPLPVLNPAAKSLVPNILAKPDVLSLCLRPIEGICLRSFA